MNHVALISLAAAIALTACSGTSAASEVASLDPIDIAASEQSDDPAVDTEAAMLEMAECMRSEGVDVADPQVDGDGNVLPPRPADPANADRQALQAAREACSEFLEGVEIGFRDVDQTELQDTLLEYATCMRDNGYDMADPDLSALEAGPGQGPGGGPFGELDRSDPDFIAAQEVCEDVLGDFGFRGPPGRGEGQG